MKKLYYITNRVTSEGYSFEERRGEVFEVGGLWFGCARSSNGRISTITELSTGLKVADAKKSDVIETVTHLLPAIKNEFKRPFIQKVAEALEAYAAKQAKPSIAKTGQYKGGVKCLKRY